MQSTIQHIQFQVNNINKELDYNKKIFSESKIKTIEESKQGVRKLEMEVQLLNMGMDQYAKKLDIDKLEQMFNNYTPLH